MSGYKKIIYALLSAVLLLLPAMNVQAEDESKSMTFTYINPVYQYLEKDFEEENVRTYALKKSASSVQTVSVSEEDYLTDKEDVAEVIRKGMVARKKEISFYYKSKNILTEQENLQKNFDEWREFALIETENPIEGDYLRWHWMKTGISVTEIKFESESPYYYYKCVWTADYYTTATQEAEVTEEIERVLDSLGVKNEEVSDYEKIIRIYNYICENIVYDTGHVCNDDCRLMHTAYAAIIQKKAVCQGYAVLLYRMLEEVGIDTRVVFGISHGENHTWNISKLDSYYYLLDSTWDAGDTKYTHFLKGSDDFSDHASQSDFLTEYRISRTDYNPEAEVERPDRVSSLSVENKYNGVCLTWKKSEQAEGYIIYRRYLDTEYEELVRITDGDTVTYTDKSIKQGKRFLYNIVAVKTAANGTELTSLKRANASQIVRATVKSITNQNGSVKITWTKVPDAAGYKVYRKASGYSSYGMLKNIKNGSTTSYTDEYAKSIRNGKASYYYVVPYYSNSSSVVLKTNTKTNYYMTRPTVSSLTASGSGAVKVAVKVAWKKNSSATGYQVRYSLSSDMSDAETVKISSGNTLSKKVSGLKKNKIYYVQVRTYKTYSGTSYYSAWSSKKSIKTKS